MVEKQEILTQEGYNKIEEEVEYLKTIKRKEVAERIKVAISFGDLSENAEYDEAKNFEDNTWVQVTGEIYKGNYHGDMPIIKVTDIKTVDKPSQEEYVYPPDDSYIPTAGIL